jgi:hypothetical protein
LWSRENVIISLSLWSLLNFCLKSPVFKWRDWMLCTFYLP